MARVIKRKESERGWKERRVWVRGAADPVTWSYDSWEKMPECSRGEEHAHRAEGRGQRKTKKDKRRREEERVGEREREISLRQQTEAAEELGQAEQTCTVQLKVRKRAEEKRTSSTGWRDICQSTEAEE